MVKLTEERQPDRREIMRWAVGLVGGMGALTVLEACTPADQTGPGAGAGAYFSSEAMELVSAVAGIIIPVTDTPGAVEVGVPTFIDGMMTNWASAETQAAFSDLLNHIDEIANGDHSKPFLKLNDQQQYALVSKIDTKAYSSDGHPAYRRFKELVLTGYYWSESGATQELLYEAVPGRWEACVPFEDVGRTWAYTR